MPILALNGVLPQTMRAKYQVAIAIAPIGLVLASILPTWLFASWLATYLGVPMNGPVKEHPNGLLWLLVFLLAAVIMLILGYLAGWLVNIAFSRYILGWSSEKVYSVYMQSDVPSHWLKDSVSSPNSAANVSSRNKADLQSIKKWEEQRKNGALHFIATRGVLGWGAPMLIAMYIVPNQMKGRGFPIEDILFNVGLWSVAGATSGALTWYSLESNYRKLKKRQET